MGFTLLNVLLVVAGTVLVDWLTFAAFVQGLPGLTVRGARSYRDFFFPRILFVAAAGVLVAYAASRGAGADVAGVLGLLLFVVGQLIQYFRFFTD
jgi:hypothetical protein